jgi:hypothetical protein
MIALSTRVKSASPCSQPDYRKGLKGLVRLGKIVADHQRSPTDFQLCSAASCLQSFDFASSLVSRNGRLATRQLVGTIWRFTTAGNLRRQARP